MSGNSDPRPPHCPWNCPPLPGSHPGPYFSSCSTVPPVLLGHLYIRQSQNYLEPNILQIKFLFFSYLNLGPPSPVFSYISDDITTQLLKPEISSPHTPTSSPLLLSNNYIFVIQLPTLIPKSFASLYCHCHHPCKAYSTFPLSLHPLLPGPQSIIHTVSRVMS